MQTKSFPWLGVKFKIHLFGSTFSAYKMQSLVSMQEIHLGLTPVRRFPQHKVKEKKYFFLNLKSSKGRKLLRAHRICSIIRRLLP